MRITYLDNDTVKVIDIGDRDLSQYHCRMRYAPLVVLVWDILLRDWVRRIVPVSLN